MTKVIEITSSDIDFKKGVCAICRKNPVSRWCDFTTRYQQTIFFFRNFQDFKEANTYGAQNTQCNLPMCENCSIEQVGDMHLCPHHQNLMELADQPNEYLRMRQQRETYEIDANFLLSQPLEGEVMDDKDFYFKVQKVVEDNMQHAKEKSQLLKEIEHLKKKIADYESGQMMLF